MSGTQTSTDSQVPDVSIVLVSDYAGGEEKSWHDLRQTLRALAAQTYGGTYEVLLVENRAFADAIPSDLDDCFPGLRVLPVDDNRSYVMKQQGVLATEAPRFAFLDADCVPVPGWLAAGMRALDENAEASLCSGLMSYPNRNLGERILSLTGRSHVCRRGPGYTEYIANPNVIYRRDAYMEYPLREDAGPFGGRLHAHALLRRGHRFYFEPAMRVTHDFEDLAMERDIRRSMGFATVRMRQLDGKLPFAWFVRVGVLSVPLFFAARLAQTWGWCLRFGAYHGVRAFEVPLAMLSAVRSHIYEVPGMLMAFAGADSGEPADSKYRWSRSRDRRWETPRCKAWKTSSRIRHSFTEAADMSSPCTQRF